MNYTYYISSPLISGTQYGSKGFASPMKELNEQTVLVESCENKNDSYRQKTKYDDRVDGYFSTYDLGILLQNRDSCLEGKLDSDGDVDYYSFSYGQKSFYEKMGVGTEITIRLENIPEGSDYDLAVYDAKGNQIGIAKNNGNGGKELTLPDWDGSDRYTIRVENHGNGNGNVDAEEPYRIRIMEEKYQKQEKADGRQDYSSEIEKLHREQYDSLPEDERYTGTESVEGLLEKKSSGEILDKREEAYLKIFANLHDYERAAANGRLKNTLFPKMQEALEKAGIDVQGKEYAIEMDIYGKITVTGELSEEEKRKAADVLEEQFSDELWDCHMQASDYTTVEFNRIDAYREISSFLGKATGGQYSCDDISVDVNGNISGLPEKMCQLLNSQESNGRYEQLRDDILMLYDYGMVEFSSYKVRYEVSDYSLWGGSAGARMAAWLGSYGTVAFGEEDYPRPGAVIMQYTGLSEVTGAEPPTYACVGTSDGIAYYEIMEERIRRIQVRGTSAEIEIFDGLPHGFGLGEGTVAEGWFDHAVAFWEENMAQ